MTLRKKMFIKKILETELVLKAVHLLITNPLIETPCLFNIEINDNFTTSECTYYFKARVNNAREVGVTIVSIIVDSFRPHITGERNLTNQTYYEDILVIPCLYYKTNLIYSLTQ